MLGNPKYNYGDVVKFKLGEDIELGVIAIIDKYGTFEDNSDVSYDILNKEKNILFKHIPEGYVFEKIDEIPENKIWETK